MGLTLQIKNKTLFKVGIQKLQHLPISFYLILFLHKPVAFIFEENVFNRYTIFFYCSYNFIRLYLEDTWIVRSLEDH